MSTLQCIVRAILPLMLAVLLGQPVAVRAAADPAAPVCEHSGQPCQPASGWTRVGWADQDGEIGHHDFATLVFAFSWMIEQEGQAYPLAGLRRLEVVDFPAAQTGEIRWLELPIDRLIPGDHAGQWVVKARDGITAESGPWIVNCDEQLAAGTAPYVYACSSLEDAAALAIVGRGAIYHWQRVLELIFADLYSLSATIDDLPNSPPDSAVIPSEGDDLSSTGSEGSSTK